MKTLVRIGCLASSFISVGVLLAAPCWAGPTYQLTPSSLTLAPSGSQSNGAFRVRSTGDEPVAIEIRITERQMDLQGHETRPEAEADFVIYPPQILLQPGESQTVRVTWLGDPAPAHELPYRLITEQLPIDLDTPNVGGNTPTVSISALYSYVATVYIAPPGASPDVVLTRASHQTASGEDRLLLEFDNQGTAHQLLSGLTLTLAPQGQPEAAITLGADQLPGMSGENILAQHQRQFTIPWPDDLPIGPVTATFDLP
jgi:fimbrial chaperone protein